MKKLLVLLLLLTAGAYGGTNVNLAKDKDTNECPQTVNFTGNVLVHGQPVSGADVGAAIHSAPSVTAPVVGSTCVPCTPILAACALIASCSALEGAPPPPPAEPPPEPESSF